MCSADPSAGSVLLCAFLSAIFLASGFINQAHGQQANDAAGQSNRGANASVSGAPLQGSAEAQQAVPMSLTDSGGHHTLQGNATAGQTRLSRPVVGGVQAQLLNGGIGDQRSTPLTDFAKAFPTIDPNTPQRTRLTSGADGDIGIIGEIETLSLPHVITQVFLSSPAIEAGMMVGDTIYTADGRDALPRFIMGAPGTPVTIVWSHRGQMRTSVLIRREAGRVPMDYASKQAYLKTIGGFFGNFGRGW
jgi:hypothetical protein